MATSAEPAIFDRDLLTRLARLRVVSKRVLASGLAGEHRVNRRGAGAEFADYRPYVPGDDLRALDPGAWLRLDKLFVRLYEEQGDLSLYIFLDNSASLTKAQNGVRFRLARQVAGMLGWIALHRHDPVDLWTYSHQPGPGVFGLRGAAAGQRLLRFLETLEATGGETGGTRLAAVLHSAFAAQRRRGLVVVISDFLDDDWQDAFRRLAALRHDVLIVHLTDSADPKKLPPIALLIDSEDGSQRRVRARPSLIKALHREQARHREDLENACRRWGFGYLGLEDEESLDQVLLRTLARGRVTR